METNKRVLLRVQDVKQYFPVKKSGGGRQVVKANDGISLDFYEGETFGLVGESGCGKSTLGRVLLQLTRQTAGSVYYYGRPLCAFPPRYRMQALKEYPARKRRLEALRAATPHQAALDDVKHKAQALEVELARLVGGLVLWEDAQQTARALMREQQSWERAAAEGSPPQPGREAEALRTACRERPRWAEFEAQREEGIDLSQLTAAEMRRLRRDLQMIFQDPYSSLDPRMTVGQIVGEGLRAHAVHPRGEPMRRAVLEVMEECGLPGYLLHRYPHQFSGGQRQRIGIARSLALRPRFVVCDEAVSALDVSIQSQIINLLLDLREREKLTYLFITHDLSVVKYISDRVGVMYLGKLVELAGTESLFARPRHPYTEALLSAIPSVEGEPAGDAGLLEGDPPSPVDPPPGCRFHTRCPRCTAVCRRVEPPLVEHAPGHFAACHHPLGQEAPVPEAAK
jgi:peptide/nickel transport system ATP-binding protein